jgi:Zn-finger nucleic acid-binding protein
MDKVEFENTGIVIDKCTDDHGVWFDSGELKSILKTAEEQNSRIIDMLKEIFGE